MDQCACGRPLWDDAKACEACVDNEVEERKRYRDRSKFATGNISGIERVRMRQRMSNLGRGYQQ